MRPLGNLIHSRCSDFGTDQWELEERGRPATHGAGPRSRRRCTRSVEASAKGRGLEGGWGSGPMRAAAGGGWGNLPKVGPGAEGGGSEMSWGLASPSLTQTRCPCWMLGVLLCRQDTPKPLWAHACLPPWPAGAAEMP